MSGDSQAPPEAISVLVVDDNPSALYVTSRILRSAGYHVLEARSGGSALAKAHEARLLVLDVNLPDMDGYEVCRRLRKDPVTRDTPVLHLSATFTHAHDFVSGMQAGADGYLTRPVEPAVLLGVVRNLLFARGAEQRRRTLDRRFQTTFDLVPSGLVVIDAQFRFETVNPAFCAMLGKPAEDVVGRHVDEFLCEKSPRLSAIIASSTGSDAAKNHVVCLMRGDEMLELECGVSRDAEAGSAVVQLSDITQRQREQRERESLLEAEKLARAEAERSNRAKDEFLATLSHELRNPLNAILGWTAVLLRVPALPAPFEQGLAAIDRNSKLQAQLIADLLDSAGMTFGKLRLSLATVDPHAPLKAATEVSRPNAEARGVTLVQRFTNQRVSVEADTSRLQQIALNLLSNAIKFTDAGGTVTISTEAVDGQFVLQVQDNGKGIAIDFLPYIFDRFSQEDASRSRRYSGLGLGLAIVKNLVDMHGGSIEVSSGGLGKGATVTVRLPASHPADTLNVGSAPESTPSLQGRLVLVVEDDEDTRQLVSRILMDAGAQVLAAGGEAAALALLAEHEPALMLCDIGMADCDGYALLRRLRGHGWNAARLPAIALTAFARPEDERDAVDAGFQLHLSKPVDPDHLVRAAYAVVGAR